MVSDALNSLTDPFLIPQSTAQANRLFRTAVHAILPKHIQPEWAFCGRGQGHIYSLFFIQEMIKMCSCAINGI